MNLLVTGGAGFIGSNLIHHVIGNPEIAKLINLDCLSYAGNLANLEGVHGVHPSYVFEKVDLRNLTEVCRVVREHNITHVIHAAAETHVDRSISGPADFITTNVNGTFHLLEACREHWLEQDAQQNTTRRFLHISTDEVYGSLGPCDTPFTEKSPYAPNSPYSASKAASDHLVRSYHQTYGLPILITHCSNNYGPRQHSEKFIPTIIRSLVNRQPIPVYGDGGNVRDWLHVEDHCRALWGVLTRGQIGEVYNIGASNEWNNLQLVEHLCDLFDTAHAKPNGSSRALITFVTDRAGHDRRYAVDSSKLRNELNWSPIRTFEVDLSWL